MTDTGCQIKRDDKHFSKKVEQAKKMKMLQKEGVVLSGGGIDGAGL
jgi:agmatine/peptidylarginine deiminase